MGNWQLGMCRLIGSDLGGQTCVCSLDWPDGGEPEVVVVVVVYLMSTLSPLQVEEIF